MAETKDKIIGNVLYTYVALNESIEFICARCKKRKISKKYAEYVTPGGKKAKICNGCYGRLISLNK